MNKRGISKNNNNSTPVIELNVFDITVHRVKENSHIPVIELNVFSPLPCHKYLVGVKKIENLFDSSVHRVKENSHIPVTVPGESLPPCRGLWGTLHTGDDIDCNYCLLWEC